MDAGSNEPTLQGLAQRLEALERNNERMRSENAELRQEVSTLRGSGTRRDEVVALRGSDEHRDHGEPVSQFEGQVSRRSLLSKAGAAAVAAVAAGTLMYPRQAKADHFGPGINVDFVWAHDDGANATGVVGQAPGGYGVRGEGGKTGVWGSASETGWEGVFGEHTGTSGYGIVGFGKGFSGAGVLGRNSDGPGVQGEYTGSGFGTGVVGKGETGVKGEGFVGVSGEGDFDRGYGVKGDGGNFGVKGECATSHGSGVFGYNTGPGIGVNAISEGGIGGQFNGAKAQLKLVPKPAGTTGKPSGAHTKGEIYMDATGALFMCVKGGSPATWRKVSTTAV